MVLIQGLSHVCSEMVAAAEVTLKTFSLIYREVDAGCQQNAGAVSQKAHRMPVYVAWTSP